MLSPFDGPMLVKKVLPNDLYIVCDREGSYRTNRISRYERVVAVDKMKPWVEAGGVSDDTDSDSGSDGVVPDVDPDVQ